MNIPLSEIITTMTTILEKRGLSAEDIPFVIAMYLGGETRGHTSHGLASFPGFARKDFSNLASPEVIKETHSFLLIDAKSTPGTLVGKYAADEAIKRAKQEISSCVMIKNMEGWLRPGAIAQYIAEQGYIAVVCNSGGGTAIAPPGGFDPVVGTNPIAYGVPTNTEPLVVDMATAKRAWGQVRLANKNGTDLPADTFYNDRGEITRDPKEAWSVSPFGEYKGFSLALLVEIMCGSLVGMDMMVESTSGNNFGQRMPDRGACIMVIDPSQTTELVAFKQANTDYLEKIIATRPLAGQTIRIPGQQASTKQVQSQASDSLEVPDDIWHNIQVLLTEQ